LKNLAAHNHLSIRTEVMDLFSYKRCCCAKIDGKELTFLLCLRCSPSI
jgi:hypothetical protein